ncbi:MAG: hypothetical protein ACHQ5A_07220 [Opitutales bacterium]
MRRHASLACLLLAWFCANGAVWDAVQVVAWGRMFSDYSQFLPVAKALEKTFDGSQPCEICRIAQHGQDTTARQQPAAIADTSDHLVLACETAAPLVLTAPDFSWPSVVDDTGSARAERVPVPPPRV